MDPDEDTIKSLCLQAKAKPVLRKPSYPEGVIETLCLKPKAAPVPRQPSYPPPAHLFAKSDEEPEAEPDTPGREERSRSPRTQSAAEPPASPLGCATPPRCPSPEAMNQAPVTPPTEEELSRVPVTPPSPPGSDSWGEWTGVPGEVPNPSEAPPPEFIAVDSEEPDATATTQAPVSNSWHGGHWLRQGSFAKRVASRYKRVASRCSLIKWEPPGEPTADATTQARLFSLLGTTEKYMQGDPNFAAPFIEAARAAGWWETDIDDLHLYRVRYHTVPPYFGICL